MKILLIIAMAFIVPMAGVFIFIVIDKAMDKLFNRLKNKGRNKRYVQIQPVAASQQLPLPEQSRAHQPQPVPKGHGCKSCAGCKLAAKGGCPRLKQTDSAESSRVD